MLSRMGSLPNISFAHFDDPERAARILQSLGAECEGAFERIRQPVLDALGQCADPDMALNNLERWVYRRTSRSATFRYLQSHLALLTILVTLSGASQFFADILIQNPEMSELLADPDLRREPKTSADLHRELATVLESATDYAAKLDRLRYAKQGEFLRIGAMDLTREWSLPQVVRALSDFADACIQTAYDVCHSELSAKHGMVGDSGLAVIAMGKLGGRELNYSSDIDLVFVHADSPRLSGEMEPSEYAVKLAEAIANALSARMTRGFVFRVDMRLRPEGRFGVITRSVSACRQYYENWAENWEFQALIKARFCAGDTSVGAEFEKMVQPLVYRRYVLATTIDEVRHNKQRLEQQTRAGGVWETNLKNGWGGIRDIEFAVQLLQIVHGGRQPRVREGSTLEAIEALRVAGSLSDTDASALRDSYCFLRAIEHRVQFLDELQTHILPRTGAGMRRLARSIGYDTPEDLMDALSTRRSVVREIFERVFYDAPFAVREPSDEWTSLLSRLEAPEARDDCLARLHLAGFAVPDRAYHLLRAPLVGTEYVAVSPETRRAFSAVAPRIMAYASRSPDPDALLIGIERLVEASPNRTQMYLAFRESPDVLRRLSELAVYARPVFDSAVRYPELLDVLFSVEMIEAGAKTLDTMREELRTRCASAKTAEAVRSAIVRYARRETARIGARDVWGEVASDVTSRDLSNLADTLIGAVLHLAAQEAWQEEATEQMALIGLGKLGGRELAFASDWDLIFVHPEGPIWAERAPRVAEVFLETAADLRTQGAPTIVDARLRPEGRFGVLSRTVESYRQYYAEVGEVWERQALLKPRFVTGNADLGDAFLAAANEHSLERPFMDIDVREALHTRNRVKVERLDPDQRETDVKLGRGGLFDIEFATQLIQLAACRQGKRVRTPNTLDALRQLDVARCLDRADYTVLSDAYTYLYTLRNRMFLATGAFSDVLPSEPVRLWVLARSMRFTGPESFLEAHQSRIRETANVIERLLKAV